MISSVRGVVRESALLGSNVFTHALGQRDGQEDLVAVEDRLAAAVADRLGEPLEVPHLLARHLADGIGEPDVAEKHTVNDVLDDRGVLECQIDFERRDDLGGVGHGESSLPEVMSRLIPATRLGVLRTFAALR